MDSKNTSKRIAVFDVETFGLNATKKAFKCGVVMTFEKIWRFTDHETMRLHLLSMENYNIYAHNLEYDSNTMFGNVWLIDKSPIYTNSLLLSFKMGKNEYVNSLQVFQAPLAKIAQNLGMEKPDLGYLLEGELLLDYCEHDCLILLTALKRFIKIDGFLKKTIASQAMKKYRLSFNPEPMTSKNNSLIRPTYYGGRCEAFKLGKAKAWYYDVNSLYPFVASEIKYPDMRFSTCLKKPTPEFVEKKINLGYGGFFCGVIFVPKCVPPPLPFRNEKTKKIIYPTGYINGFWTFLEVENALQFGCTIISCDSIVYCPLISRDSLKNYCTHYYNEKLNAKGFMVYYNKLMLNALLGKFGQRGITKRSYFEDYTIIDPKVFFNPKNEIKFFKKSGKNGYIETLSEREIYDASISIYITSAARVYMYHFMQENYEDLLYMDTDSLVFSKEKELPISPNKLGYFKVEHENVDLEIFGAKNYKIGDKKVLKGVPKKATEIEPFLFEYLKMNSGKQALRNNRESGIFETIRKKINLRYDKRLVDLNNGNTTPIYIEKI